MLKSWLRAKEAAKHIGCSEAKLASDRVKGVGPAYSKIGRLVIYDQDELDNHAAERRVEGSAKRDTRPPAASSTSNSAQ